MHPTLSPVHVSEVTGAGSLPLCFWCLHSAARIPPPTRAQHQPALPQSHRARETAWPEVRDHLVSIISNVSRSHVRVRWDNGRKGTTGCPGKQTSPPSGPSKELSRNETVSTKTTAPERSLPEMPQVRAAGAGTGKPCFKRPHGNLGCEDMRVDSIPSLWSLTCQSRTFLS